MTTRCRCHLCGQFFRFNITAKRNWYCGVLCRQRGNSRLSAEKRGNMQRGRGERHRYTKLNGRHEHRIVMEQILGRKLRRGEIVHHKDGNGRNNVPNNLELLTQSQHIKRHYPKMYEACWGRPYVRSST